MTITMRVAFKWWTNVLAIRPEEAFSLVEQVGQNDMSPEAWGVLDREAYGLETTFVGGGESRHILCITTCVQLCISRIILNVCI